MSHETVLADLNALSKTTLENTSGPGLAHHIMDESDRVALILNGSLIEHALVYFLEKRMPSINSDEKARLFNNDGPLGTFAYRTRFAQALGMIDRPTTRKIDIIRAMRNAAAHCIERVSFTNPAIIAGIQQTVSAQYRAEVGGFTPLALKTLLSLTAANICSLIEGKKVVFEEQERLTIVRPINVQPGASPGKPSAE